MAPAASATDKQVSAVLGMHFPLFLHYQDNGSWMGLRSVIDFHFVQLFLIVRMGVMTLYDGDETRSHSHISGFKNQHIWIRKLQNEKLP